MRFIGFCIIEVLLLNDSGAENTYNLVFLHWTEVELSTP
jgi:hypothetical protein